MNNQEHEDLIKILKRIPSSEFLDLYLNWKEPTFDCGSYGYTIDELRDLIDKQYEYNPPIWQNVIDTPSAKALLAIRQIDQYLTHTKECNNVIKLDKTMIKSPPNDPK